MHFKSLLKSILLLGAPLVAYAIDENCANPDKIDTDGCQADILIVTTAERTEKQNEGYAAALQTLSRLSIPANQLTVQQNGVADDEILRILYRGNPQEKKGRYKAIVFPNGRVSYNNVVSGSEDEIWRSAISWYQWQLFQQYSADTKSRIVYLNEYPSNNTGTDIAYKDYQSIQKITLSEDSILYDELQGKDLNTEKTWHYPAKLLSDDDIHLTNGFTSVTPLLYFEPTDTVPERTIAAVECEIQDAQFAAFYTSFGSWSATAAALSVYWIQWALQTDIQHASSTHMTTAEALNASAAPKTIQLALGCIVVSTIFVIFASLL